ncbi:MAG: hypothetical protein NW241_01470 [Bacteroidia bacterium]|nr:hypothetical protein [Bacteroidia bacterium]
MNWGRFLLRLMLILALTVLTQTGGLVYLASWPLRIWPGKRIRMPLARRVWNLTAFLLLYLLTSLLIVPLAAPLAGRVPLPILERGHVEPLRAYTWLCNRHYVRPVLRDAVLGVAARLNNQYPGTQLYYLDAGFPFFDGFPLLPHLRHDDGRKLDLAFCYLDVRTGRPAAGSPALLGYGVCEEPRTGETHTARACAEAGHWQYSLLGRMLPAWRKQAFQFDPERTAALVSHFAAHPDIGKIFLEPHLRTRMRLSSDKVRFHGCRAVRHDDHLHVQL